jgi:hypothetical protein
MRCDNTEVNKMKFLIYNGSLKPDAESNTFAVCKMTQLAFEKLGHECEIITLRELDYEGATADVDDDLKPELMKMFQSGWRDIRNTHMVGTAFVPHTGHAGETGSHILVGQGQRPYQPMYNKVFGSLVSGGGDGFQHIHGVCIRRPPTSASPYHHSAT